MGSSSAMSPAPGTANCCGAFTCLPFFVAGVVGLALVEFLLVLYLLERLLNISSRPSVSPASDLKIESEENSISLQGKAWIAPLPDDVDLTKVTMRQIRKDKNKDKDGQRDGSRRGEGPKDVLEIAPVRMQAFLMDKSLLLRAADGTEAQVSLEGCEILTISSSPGPSRKWGKKFPIKLHHSDRELYHGRKTLLFFSESGYAKEAWCEAFRAMARTDPSLSEWTFKTKRKYREYTRVAEENRPYLTKFYATDEASHMDVKQEAAEGQSKRRMMWRKLARKASIGTDCKAPKFCHTVDEIKRRKEARSQRHDDKDWKNEDTSVFDEDHRGTSVSVAEIASHVVDPNFDHSTSFEGLANGEALGSVSEGNNPAPASTQQDNRDSHGQVPATQQKTHKPKDTSAGKKIEQGVLCLNMIVARLYFDFNQSVRRLASVERFFQRLLMKIRAPSYIKSISIKELDLGRHPPFATAIRMLPSDAEGSLAVELDLEWRGGGHLTCETRLDLRDQSTQEKVAAQLTESGSERDAEAALLSGIRRDFDVAGSASFSAAVQEGIQPGDEGSNKKGGILLQSVKSLMSRVGDRVSQVPIVLKIRLVSLKGTVVLRLKAPPSDRVWFAFKEMPEIHFEPQPCIGEHRISSSAVGRFIANQIKVQIRESVVLPYCEDFFLDWMVADKDNWLRTSAFPFPFFDSQSSEAERELSKRNAEREHSKHNAEIQSSSSDEDSRSGHQPLPRSQNTRNGQNKPPKGQASQRPVKAQKHGLFSHTNNRQPGTSVQEPNHGLLQPIRSGSGLLFSKFSAPKPPRTASSVHLNAQSSVPKPPRTSSRAHLSALLSDPVQMTASTALSLASPSVRKESRPLIKYDEPHKEETLGSAGESEPATSSVARGSRSKDYSSHSEGSASESDVHFLATQVADPEEVKDSVHVVPLTRRARMLSLGKKVGTRLDEGRRNALEKLHHKRPDDSDGSAHSQSSGRWVHESPFAEG